MMTASEREKYLADKLATAISLDPSVKEAYDYIESRKELRRENPEDSYLAREEQEFQNITDKVLSGFSLYDEPAKFGEYYKLAAYIRERIAACIWRHGITSGYTMVVRGEIAKHLIELGYDTAENDFYDMGLVGIPTDAEEFSLCNVCRGVELHEDHTRAARHAVEVMKPWNRNVPDFTDKLYTLAKLEMMNGIRNHKNRALAELEVQGKIVEIAQELAPADAFDGDLVFKKA
jgi:hypothetical protein